MPSWVVSTSDDGGPRPGRRAPADARARSLIGAGMSLSRRSLFGVAAAAPVVAVGGLAAATASKPFAVEGVLVGDLGGFLIPGEPLRYSDIGAVTPMRGANLIRRVTEVVHVRPWSEAELADTLGIERERPL